MNLITPFGGKLINLIVEGEERARLLDFANRLPSVQLSERNICDLELLATGAFSPLETFMNRADFETVLGEIRIANGTLFSMPISLPCADFFLLSQNMMLIVNRFSFPQCLTILFFTVLILNFC